MSDARISEIADPAYVEVWGKGFRVSQDTEEFQRLVPKKTDLLNSTPDFDLALIDNWGTVLEPLYGMSGRDLAAQRCLLIRSRELTFVSFASTNDRHRRASLVLVAVRTPISWSDGRLGDLASRSHALSARLAEAYAQVFEQNPSTVERQLRDDTFLSDRRFDLAAEVVDERDQWPSVLEAVKEWRGIFGVATPKLLPLGANVVLGTKHEAEMTRRPVDGYFDVRDQRIRPLSSKLSRWEPAPQIAAPVEPTAISPQPASTGDASVPSAPRELVSIDASLRGIDGSLRQISDAVVRLCEHALTWWIPDKRRSRK